MRILISTFGEGDAPKILEAMRRLPYDRLALLGNEGAESSSSFSTVKSIEELAGHEVDFETVSDSGFMVIVDEIAAILSKLSKDPGTGEKARLIMNISGGSKILGDAALLAAFRVGVEACHCDQRLTMLPILRDATAIDRFTPSQVKFIRLLSEKFTPLDGVESRSQFPSRQATERVMRELRKLGLIRTELSGGKINVALSEAGCEVSRALSRQGPD